MLTTQGKNPTLLALCFSKEDYVPSIAPIFMPRPPGRSQELQKDRQKHDEKHCRPLLVQAFGQMPIRTQESVPPWWEGWCLKRRKPVWEGGTQRSVWVSRRKGQLSQISSLSPLFQNMTNSWLQWIHIQAYCVGIIKAGRQENFSMTKGSQRSNLHVSYL